MVIKITKSIIQNLAVIVTSRERVSNTAQQNCFVDPNNIDLVFGLLREKSSAVIEALAALKGGLSFSPGGHDLLMSLDGRETLVKNAAKILSGPELCKNKLEDAVR